MRILDIYKTHKNKEQPFDAHSVFDIAWAIFQQYYHKHLPRKTSEKMMLFPMASSYPAATVKSSLYEETTGRNTVTIPSTKRLARFKINVNSGAENA